MTSDPGSSARPARPALLCEVSTAEKYSETSAMGWLAFGVAYAVTYGIVGSLLRGHALAELWFRLPALLVTPLLGIMVILRRRRAWSGCQWLFWATIALGLMMSALGLVGWTVDELMLGRRTSWLGWHAVFALFGGVAPLFALLMQPHRGTREGAVAGTAVDIAGLAVVTGFLYSYFVMTEDLSPVMSRPSFSLAALMAVQQFLVAAGMGVAAMLARRTQWGPTYRRLALGLFVQLIALGLSEAGILQGIYRAGFVFDFVWIVPLAFFPWAAQAAPTSVESGRPGDDLSFAPSRPWVIFGALALLPVVDFGLRRFSPLGPADTLRNVSMAVTVFSALPILMARLAVERAQTRQVDAEVRLLAAAIEQAEELIWIVSRDGRFRHANAAFRQALAYTPAELDTMGVSELISDRAGVEAAAIEDAVRTGSVWRGTIARRRKDGSTFPSSATIVPLSDERGEPAHVLGVERDITEQLKLHQQLIHSERLSAAGQLVSGVAHELNNPLQSILGFTELLLENEQRRGPRHDLERVRAETERAGRIVTNLLTFVRRSSSERVRADLNGIVKQAVALRAYEMKTGNIELDERYGEGPHPVMVNPQEIQQIVLNLILNAEHAMRTAHGGGRLLVRTEMTAAGASVEVRDEGPGIPPDLAGRVFEPFFTTKDVGKGTGLGLAIALGIAESHQGSLALVPSSSGACFRLTLPRAEDRPAVERKVTTSHVVSAASGGRRALVADDEAQVRELLRRLLIRRGFSVDLADDGEAASALIDAGQYDLTLCDVRMPKVGGLQVYERVRARYPHLLKGFAFISGDTLGADVRQSVEPMQVPMLPKPFSTADLDALLQRLGTSSS
jgi:PAS domain S-box-containing protein